MNAKLIYETSPCGYRYTFRIFTWDGNCGYQYEKVLENYESINLSIITYYEILNGLLYKDARKQLKRFFEFAELNKILPLTLSATKQAAEIYANLRKKGQPIGHTDCLIAGIALKNNLQLVTNNIDHFKRVKGLEIVNWLH